MQMYGNAGKRSTRQSNAKDAGSAQMAEGTKERNAKKLGKFPSLSLSDYVYSTCFFKGSPYWPEENLHVQSGTD